MGNYYFCKGDKLTITSYPVVHNTVRKENKTWTTRRKRKNHVPQKFELVKDPALGAQLIMNVKL